MDLLKSDLIKKKKCPRVVRRHKYERLSQNNKIWWNNKFKELEANVGIPWYEYQASSSPVLQEKEPSFHQKYGGLKCVVISNDPKSIQEFHRDDDNDDERQGRFNLKKSASSAKRRRTYASTIYVPRRRISLDVKKGSFVKRLSDFYKKTPEEAKVWSPKQKRLNNSMHLIERATLVEEALAEDFDKWFSDIETYSTSQINKETILKIFEINSSLSIHKAIVVNMQLIKSVPDSVAKYLGDPEVASSRVVKREIYSDIKASKIEPINIAFGKELPPHLRKYKHISDNRIKSNADYKELESFATVFKDIMELETCKRFVNWLGKHPYITPPPFLKKYMAVRQKGAKRSLYIRQIYEAKVWSIGKQSEKNVSEDSLSSSSDDSDLLMNFLV